MPLARILAPSQTRTWIAPKIALLDIIIAIGVVIDDADGWVGVEAFGANKRMWLGRLAVDHKSNEISAIPLHLDLLDLHDATVTIGAMGCQTAIVSGVGTAS